MRALVAFDKFKDSMTAATACATAAATLRRCRPDWILDCAPLTDGGEGFAEILTTAAHGELRLETVTGPRGGEVSARFGLVTAAQVPEGARTMLDLEPESRIAIVEMAAASGVALLSPAERDPWRTTTRGTGELLRLAAAAGATAILLGVGGSATNDLGLGALTALGLSLSGADSAAPMEWPKIERLGGRLVPLPPVFIACDVINPLLGPIGATAIYGPQKGLRAEDVTRLDHEAARMALMICAHFNRPDTMMDTPGAGAAGGIAFGLMAALNARLLPGFDFVSQWLDLKPRVAAADIVLTGEGRFDASSMHGKGPGTIAARALELGKCVHVFAGAVAARPPTERLSLHAITPPDMPLDRALREGPDNLGETVHDVFAAGAPVSSK